MLIITTKDKPPPIAGPRIKPRAKAIPIIAIPFERFFVGGDGLGSYSLDGRESIALRGYPNQSLSSADGGTIYNKFSLELPVYTN